MHFVPICMRYAGYGDLREAAHSEASLCQGVLAVFLLARAWAFPVW
jgi:hypothetical protein